MAGARDVNKSGQRPRAVAGDAPRAVAWDVIAGWVLGLIAASIVTVVVAAAFGWDPITPNGVGGPMGRGLTEAATGQELADPPIPFTVRALFQLPFWAMLIGVPLGVAHLRGRDLIEDFGLRMKAVDVPVGLIVGLASQFLMIPALYFPLRPFIDQEKVDDEAVRLSVDAASSAGGALVLVILVTVGAPLVEEIAYRGGLQRALAGRLPAFAAILIAATVFGLTHLQAVQLPALIAIGAIAGLLAHRVDRIGPAIWAHVGFNAAAAAGLLL